jgi:hypothetical protein
VDALDDLLAATMASSMRPWILLPPPGDAASHGDNETKLICIPQAHSPHPAATSSPHDPATI